MFTMTNGLKELLHFLTAQSNEVENWLRQNSDPAIDHAGSREKHVIFGRGLQYEMEKQALAYERDIDQDPEEQTVGYSGFPFNSRAMASPDGTDLKGSFTKGAKKRNLDATAKML